MSIYGALCLVNLAQYVSARWLFAAALWRAPLDRRPQTLCLLPDCLEPFGTQTREWSVRSVLIPPQWFARRMLAIICPGHNARRHRSQRQ